MENVKLEDKTFDAKDVSSLNLLENKKIEIVFNDGTTFISKKDYDESTFNFLYVEIAYKNDPNEINQLFGLNS